MVKTSKGRKAKKLMQIRWQEDLYEEIKSAADRLDEPMTVWLRRAARNQLRKERQPVADKNFPPCTICGKKHDPQDHFTGEE